jgi:hypothetical protein
MSLLPRTTLHSDSEQYFSVFQPISLCILLYFPLLFTKFSSVLYFPNIKKYFPLYLAFFKMYFTMLSSVFNKFSRIFLRSLNNLP